MNLLGKAAIVGILAATALVPMAQAYHSSHNHEECFDTGYCDSWTNTPHCETTTTCSSTFTSADEIKYGCGWTSLATGFMQGNLKVSVTGNTVATWHCNICVGQGDGPFLTYHNTLYTPAYLNGIMDNIDEIDCPTGQEIVLLKSGTIESYSRVEE